MEDMNLKCSVCECSISEEDKYYPIIKSIDVSLSDHAQIMMGETRIKKEFCTHRAGIICESCMSFYSELILDPPRLSNYIYRLSALIERDTESKWEDRDGMHTLNQLYRFQQLVNVEDLK